MTDKLELDLGERSYEIHIGNGLLAKADSLIPVDLKGRSVFILADKNVEQYLSALTAGLGKSPARIEPLIIEGGEKAKSYANMQVVLNWLLEQKVERSSVLIALGGGVIGDLGGFVASII